MAECQLRWENRNLTSVENLNWHRLENTPQLEYTGRISPSQPRRIGLPLGTFPIQIGLCGGWWSIRPAKNINYLWRLQIKNWTKPVRTRLREWGSRPPQIYCYWIFGGGLPSKILAFTHRKGYFYKGYSRTVKKTRNCNLLVEGDSWRQAESISKMKTFHTTKCRAYPH